MNAVSYLHLLKLAGPETLVVLAALVALLMDLTVMRGLPGRFRRRIAALISGVGCVAAGLYLAQVSIHGTAFGGMFTVDPLTQFVKLVLVALTLLTAVLSLEADYTDHVGEHFALLLLATSGMMFMVSAADLLMVFLALELSSLSLYSLAALNKASERSAEAALKYFLFGALAAAFTLFGFSFLYGLTGATHLAEVAAGLRGRGFDPLLAVATVLTLVGFGFKVAAVPFHLWAPDAYQGAPTPAAALIASGSKVAGFFLLGRFVVLALPDTAGQAAVKTFTAGWVPAVAVLALASMIVGNLAALAQRDLKRLLAYSAIAHAGYLLLAVLALAGAASRADAFAALVYYAGTCALGSVGAFAAAGFLERTRGDAAIAGLAGAGRATPVIAAGLVVFMLSLAGLPPLAGFPAKFYVFAAALHAGPAPAAPFWLVAAGLALSPVGLYYYLLVLKQACVVEAPSGPPTRRPAWPETLVVTVAAGGVLGLGVFPQLFLGPLMRAIQSAGL
jgi:NADH-quinone oxidoreductase subunit N